MKSVAFLGLVALSHIAHAACDVYLNNVWAADWMGNPITVTLGQNLDWGIMVSGKIKGTPSGPVVVRVYLTNKSIDIPINPVEGPFSTGAHALMPIDDIVPCSAIADVNHTSGDINYANNAIALNVTPVPPAQAVNYYDWRNWRCSRTSVYSYQGPAVTTRWVTLWGLPQNLGYQEIAVHYSPPGAQIIPSGSFADPVLWVEQNNLTEGTHSIELLTDLSSANVRVNPEILRQVRWNDMQDPPHEVAAYLQPDPLVNFNTSQVNGFVSESLPVKYRETMTPYDVARKLFRSTVNLVTYSSSGGSNAAQVIDLRAGDCGGFSVVFAAACRKVGIPARCPSGFSQGTNAFHMWAEFWLAGYGWIPVDANASDIQDPLGQYAYWFGYCPQQNNRVAVSVATEHVVTGVNPYTPFDAGFLQIPWQGFAYLNPPANNMTLTTTYRLDPW